MCKGYEKIKKEFQIASKLMKRCSNSVVITKVTLRSFNTDQIGKKFNRIVNTLSGERHFLTLLV